jgi:exopolyphosphatase
MTTIRDSFGHSLRIPKAQPLDSVASPAREEEEEAEDSAPPTLRDFLRERRREPTDSVVIGNEAGDADTIVSSLVLAYVESVQRQQPGAADKTPVAAIGRADLDTQRPEVSFLFQLAGISSGDVVCVDDPYVADLQVAEVTLTDHNRLAPAFRDRANWTVVEIVDHHQDEGEYADTCTGASRAIAFADGRALVASACTLVAERLFAAWGPASGPYPAPVGALLLGVILLDSVGLSEEVGKVTQRDRDAVHRLLAGTDWDGLPASSRQTLQLTSASPAPDPAAFFELLQDSKYDPGFWDPLSVRDALRQDYKSFPCASGFEFGVSSVLVPAPLFLSKPGVAGGVIGYMKASNVTFLAIMFAFQDDERGLHRQLALCDIDDDPSLMDDLVSHLLVPPAPPSPDGGEEGSLDLRELEISPPDRGGSRRRRGSLRLRVFDQLNPVPSRKQIGPILQEFFESRV